MTTIRARLLTESPGPLGWLDMGRVFEITHVWQEGETVMARCKKGIHSFNVPIDNLLIL